jgi:hypothetical protein
MIIHASIPGRLVFAFAWAVAGLARAEAPALTRGPYLQAATPRGVTILWRTQGETTPVVRYGRRPDRLDQQVPETAIARRVSEDARRAAGIPRLHSAPAHTWQYEAVITGLEPDTTFYYGVYDGETLLAGSDDRHYFKTFTPVGAPTPLYAWVLGCSGTGDINARRVYHSAGEYLLRQNRALTFSLHLGDMAYYDGLDRELQERFFDMYGRTLANTVCWPAFGNHEARTSDGNRGIGPYFDAFAPPTGGEAGGVPSGTEAYYSFDYGTAHFVCLNSSDADRRPNGPMARWLEADLARAAGSDWLLAFFHHPPYTRGSHDSDLETDLVEMREWMMPLLEKAGVDVVFSAHSHMYERSMLIGGAYETPTFAEHRVLDDGDGDPDGDGAYEKGKGLRPHEGAVYVVTGQGGGYQFKKGEFPLMIRSLVEFGSVFFEINVDTFSAVMLNTDGQVRDRFSIVKQGVRTPTRLARPWQPMGPVIRPAVPLFLDEVIVEIRPAAEWDDGEIRYTVDGSDPTMDSPRYREPLRFTNDVSLRARAFQAGRARSSVATAADFLQFRGALREAEAAGDAGVGGLDYSYYEGSWRKLPDFRALRPVRTGTVETIHLDVPRREDDFALVYEGFIEAPADGIFAFHLASDDGSRLLVGSKVVADNDGLHPVREKSGYIGLKAGRHPFRVEFMEAAEAEALLVEWQGPGFDRQPVPATALWRSQALHQKTGQSPQLGLEVE